MSDGEPDNFSYLHHSSDDSSLGYDDAEWLEYINADGSLLYIESYVSSTVREKQALVLRTSREKKNNNAETKADPKKESHKKENKLLGLLRRRPSIRGKQEKLPLSLAPNLPEEEDGAKAGGGVNRKVSGGSSKRGGASTGRDGASVADKQRNQGKNRDTSPAPKVTFRDNKSGELRTVPLHVVSVGDGRGGLCEAVLGVVAGRFSEPPTDRIMVAGLLPGSEAHSTHAIKIGDWLKAVNRKEVTWNNIDAVLGEIRVPSVVTLTLQQCASETLSDQDHSNRKRITQTQLVRHIAGHFVAELRSCHDPAAAAPGTEPYDLVKGAPPHVVLLLSLTGVTDSSPEGADIRYQFPRGSSRLVRVRGVFLTLAHTLHDLTHQPTSSTCVRLSNGETVHVVYAREDDLVWVMALPQAYCSEHELMCLSNIVVRNLRFEFGGLAQSVGEPSQHWYVDHLLGKVFCSVVHAPEHRALLHPSLCAPSTALPPSHYLHPHNFIPTSRLLKLDSAAAYNNLSLGGGEQQQLSSSTGSSGVWAVLGAPPWLLLQDGGGGVKMEVDNCLSELEAGDFGEEEDSDCDECDSLLHNILGCALFYKGAVVCSHLPPPCLVAVYCHARLHGLLPLTAVEAVSQLVAFRGVHLPEQEGPASLLLVAMNHLMIALLLDDSEARRSPSWRGGPDPVLVDQVEATLFHLHSLHVPALCQESLSRGGPEVVNADDRHSALVGGGRKGSGVGGGGRSQQGGATDTTSAGASPSVSLLPDVPSILKQRPPQASPEGGAEGDDMYYQPPPGLLVGEEDEEDEETSVEDGEGSQWRLWRGSTPPPSLRDADPDCPTPLTQLPVSAIRVTTGPSPALFHLVHLDVGEGVLIESLPCPPSADAPDPAAPQPPSPLHAAVLANFRSACVHVHRLLHSALFPALEDGSNQAAREHGVLFSCSPGDEASTSSLGGGKKRTAVPLFNYWVIGRVVPASGRELYVCYHESVHQNLQEMAAKLCLGASL